MCLRIIIELSVSVSVMFVCLYMCGSLECNISLQIAHSQHSTLYNEARLQRTWKITIAHSFRKRIATNVEDKDRIFWRYGAAATASFPRAHDSHVDVDYDSRANVVPPRASTCGRTLPRAKTPRVVRISSRPKSSDGPPCAPFFHSLPSLDISSIVWQQK